MTIPTLDLADIPAAIALWQAAGLTRPWNDPATDIALALASPASTIMALHEDGVLAATVMVGVDGHRGWVYYLAVAEAHRGRGLARRLMTAAEAWAAVRGVRRMNLMVRADNAAVRGFYDALGYRAADVVVLQRDL